MAVNMSKLRESTDEELGAEIQALREQLFKLRWQAASGQIENPNKISDVRRDIARHMTVLRERAAAGEKA